MEVPPKKLKNNIDFVPTCSLASMPQKKNNDRGSLAGDGHTTTIINENSHHVPLNVSQAPSTQSTGAGPTLGRYLARRLIDIGVNDIFSVPGDSNLILLDHFIAEPGLKNVGCCNELNAGYAADGYARHRGVGACAVTFTVGGLSLLNAIAGAYSQNLPVICIVGAPNTNDYGSNRILHHTIGLPDFSQELKCFETVTCYQAVVNRLEDAQNKIDRAISTALKESKPVYISISCNLVGISHPTFSDESIIFSIPQSLTNKKGLEAAADAAAAFLNRATKPVLIGGPKLRTAKAVDAFLKLAETCAYPIAVMPSAKGLLPENHPHFIGTYWGSISSPFCAEIIEISDVYLVVGPDFNETSTLSYSQLLRKEKAVVVDIDHVVIGQGSSGFGCVLMNDFLLKLAEKITKNNTAYENYDRIFVPDGVPRKRESNKPIRVNTLFQHIQKMLSGESVLLAETGDSWFNSQKLKLPDSCGYEAQFQYASIGWSVGATLGYAQSAPEKRVIACIGDGSFQMTAQDVSTMIKNRQKSVIFLINNGGYSTEVEVHDGPYNVIQNWDYTALVDAFCNGQGKCWTVKVLTEDDLIEAITTTTGEKKDSLCFIEVLTHKDDTSKELLEFGSKSAIYGSRKPIF